MIFNKLELNNFKSHRETSIDLHQGITLILGENGAGKSTIFEAISYVLFGKFKNHKRNDLIRRTNNQENIKMEVRLTFHVDGSEYLIRRGVTRSKRTTGSLKHDPFVELKRISPNREKLASTNDKVKIEIMNLLEMDDDTFLNAIHIRQGEISDLVDKKVGERKELITKLLKIQDLEDAYKAMLEIINYYTGKIEATKKNKKDENELNSKLSDKKYELDSLKNTIKVSNGRLEKINAEKEINEKEKNDLDVIKSRLNELKQNLNRQQDNLTKLNQSKQKWTNQLNEIIEDEKQMEILEPSIERLQVFNEFKDNLSEYETLKRDKSNNEKIILENNENKEIILKEKENYEKYNGLKTEIENLRSKEGELNSQLDKLSEFAKQKDIREKEIADKEGKIKRFSDEIVIEGVEDLRTIEDIDVLENLVSNKIDDIESEINQVTCKIEENGNESVRLQQINDSTSDALSKMKTAENKCPTCKSDITDETREGLINEYQNTISSNNDELEVLKRLKDDLAIDKNKKQDELNKFESIMSNISPNRIYMKDIIDSKFILVDLNEKISEAEEKVNELKEIKPLLDSKIEEQNALKPNFDLYIKAEARLKSVEEEIEIENQLRSISENMGVYEEKLNNISTRYSELSLNIQQDELKRLIGDLTTKKSEYDTLAGKVKNKSNLVEELSTNQNEIEEVTAEIQDLNDKIESCDYDETKHKKISEYVESLSEEANSLSQIILIGENDIGHMNEKISDIEKEIDENNKLLYELDSLTKFLKSLNELREHFSKNGFQKELRAKIKPYIIQYTFEFFDKFNFDYSDLKLDDDYTLSVNGPNGEVGLDMVSGGERIALALSLRLAIARVMSKGNMETILLDEPTIHLDKQRRKELIEVLRSISIIPQMIIVTHDEELENAADYIIKINKEHGISKVEQEMPLERLL